MTDPVGHQRAFDQAQRAFANGWIDMADLDRRLAAIAEARTVEEAQSVVRDLMDVEHRVLARQNESPVSTPTPGKKLLKVTADVIFGLMAVAFLINLIIWAVVAIANEGQYFWPVWLLIPLGITAVPAVLVRLFGRE